MRFKRKCQTPVSASHPLGSLLAGIKRPIAVMKFSVCLEVSKCFPHTNKDFVRKSNEIIIKKY